MVGIDREEKKSDTKRKGRKDFQALHPRLQVAWISVPISVSTFTIFSYHYRCVDGVSNISSLISRFVVSVTRVFGAGSVSIKQEEPCRRLLKTPWLAVLTGSPVRHWLSRSMLVCGQPSLSW